MLLFLAALAFLSTVSTFPTNGVEKMTKEEGVNPSAAKQRLQELLKTDIEIWKTRLRNLAKKGKIVNTPEEELEIKKKLEKLPHFDFNNSSPRMGILQANEAAGIMDYLYQGDIILTENQLSQLEQEASGGRQKRQASTINDKWPNNCLNYSFDPQLSAKARQAFTRAAEKIRLNTCVDVKEVKLDLPVNKLIVFSGIGCRTYLGMTGGNQPLSLDQNCEFEGLAMHELMHTLGVFHTQSRSDRDDFITVYEDAIEPENVNQFLKQMTWNSENYVPYEYGSVMHYSADAGAKPGQITMLVNNENFNYQNTMGSWQESINDLEVINRHYGCRAKCPVSAKTSAKCKNGGRPNPRKCATTCICPRGYGGNLCGQRPSGPGGILEADAEWNLVEYSVGDANSTDVRVSYKYVHHWIKAPAGKKIEIQLWELPFPDCNRGCTFAGIEIKTDNTVKTGYRYCCVPATLQRLTSQLNPTPIITYNNRHISKFAFRYRFL